MRIALYLSPVLCAVLPVVPVGTIVRDEVENVVVDGGATVYREIVIRKELCEIVTRRCERIEASIHIIVFCAVDGSPQFGLVGNLPWHESHRVAAYRRFSRQELWTGVSVWRGANKGTLADA